MSDTPEELPAWADEEMQRVRAGVRLFALVAIVIFLVFWIVDLIIYPESRYPGIPRAFLALRVLCALGYLPALLAIRQARDRARLTTIGCLEVWWVSGIIAAMLARTGYEHSLYYAGLVLVAMGMGLVIPWTWKESLLAGVGEVVIYVLVVAANGRRDVQFALNNTFFLIGGVGISLAANVQSGRMARAEWAARQDLARAYEQLRGLDRLKSDFMANISHEMRTPLTLMLGALESLGSATEAGFGDRPLEYLDVIRRNGLSLLRLINDLLDLARLEAAQARLRLEEVDLVELVRGITTQAGPMFAWRSLELERDVPETPVMASVDRLKIEKVVLNLLSNAIKFTPEGGHIRVAVRQLETSIEVQVEDTGIGIPPEHHERIFERFSQVDATATRARGGTGIGLALVREFVELHTGSVTVESRPGEGSRFTVRLPRDTSAIPEDRIDRRQVQADTAMARRHEDVGLGAWVATISESPEYRYGELYDVADRRTAARIEMGPRKGTVLVVEDSRDLARFIALQLASEYNVITAADGEEGWERARSDLPDLVITDLMMPRRDGFWLCEQMRIDPVTRQVPIIMLTARGQAEDRAQAREHGADVYMSKPFNVRELLAAIARLMKRKEERVASLTSETSSAMRVFTSGLAHELLNPIGFISNAVFALDEMLNDMIRTGNTARLGPTCLELLRSANVGLERVQSLIRDLRSVSEASPDVEAEPADLNASIRSTVTLAGGASLSSVRFHLDLCEDATVVCRIGRMNQVFLNLVKNALLSLPSNGGDVWVRTRRADSQLEISIADNGAGITPENLDRVFDPFFTTREPGRGTGLGLALCRRIVEEHGGTLGLTSVVGEGTRATIRIPLAEWPAEFARA